jgi:hypothetical protein
VRAQLVLDVDHSLEPVGFAIHARGSAYHIEVRHDRAVLVRALALLKNVDHPLVPVLRTQNARDLIGCIKLRLFPAPGVRAPLGGHFRAL